MEMNRNQRTQTQIPLITKLVLPFSVLSVILSYPFFSNFEILAYGVELQPLNFSIGKNYMFLLCNGLLVFIVTSSGLIRSSSDVETDRKSEKAKEFDRREKIEVAESAAKTEFVQETEESPMESLVLQYEGDENGNDQIVSVKEEVELEEEEEEDDDDDERLMSNEELNKKCEDFIRKMRDQINK